MSERRIPRLVGVEWLEHHLFFGKIGKILGIARDEVLVEEQSAGRYFGEPIRMADTDHFSIVKPASRDDDVHRTLDYFYQRAFQKVMKAPDDVAAGAQVRTDNEVPPAIPVSDAGTNKVVTLTAATPTSKPEEPVRIDEKRSAALCGDRVHIELTNVWKKSGGKPDNKVTVLSSALADGKAVIKIGNALPLMDGCSPTLVDTGRDSKYFAIFQ